MLAECLDFGEHDGLRGGDEFEVAEPKHILFNHFPNDQIAVVSRLDVVNLLIELVAIFGNIGEVLETGINDVVIPGTVYRTEKNGNLI